MLLQKKRVYRPLKISFIIFSYFYKKATFMTLNTFSRTKRTITKKDSQNSPENEFYHIFIFLQKEQHWWIWTHFSQQEELLQKNWVTLLCKIRTSSYFNIYTKKASFMNLNIFYNKRNFSKKSESTPLKINFKINHIFKKRP